MNPISAMTPIAATGDQSSATAFSAASIDTSSYGPSVTVDLSEKAKAALAAANENQDAANRILAFVDANRTGHSHQAGRASRSWSDGEPSLEQEYQQLAGNQQPSQGGVLTITLSEYANVNLSVESGSGARTISASTASTQYDTISLSVNTNSGSIQIVQSDQSQIVTAAQVGAASPVSITA